MQSVGIEPVSVNRNTLDDSREPTARVSLPLSCVYARRRATRGVAVASATALPNPAEILVLDPDPKNLVLGSMA